MSPAKKSSAVAKKKSAQHPARKTAAKKSATNKPSTARTTKKTTSSKSVLTKVGSRVSAGVVSKISERGEPLRTRAATGGKPGSEKNSATYKLAMMAAKYGLDRKAHDVRVLKLKDLSSVCDYFVILSGDADVHVRAIADSIEDSLAKVGHWPTYREGKREGNWIVLDYIDVVVHVFMDGTRRFYQLEKLWGDAPSEVVTDD